MATISTAGNDALTPQQRNQIFREQMAIERQRLEVMHANLLVSPPDDHEDVEKALKLRLGAGELAAMDGSVRGKIDDFLVARIDPDDDEEPIVIMTWSDLAESFALDGAEEAAVNRLCELGIEQSALRQAMARKVVNVARVEAIREFRQVLTNPGAAYAPVPVPSYDDLSTQPAMPALKTAHHNAPISPTALDVQPQSDPTNPWATLTPTQAVNKFFAHKPRTGGEDGTARPKTQDPWTEKTREQFRLPALLLEQVMGGRPLSTVTHDDLVKLNTCFDKLHGPSFRKSPKHREMTIWEIVAETQERVKQGQELLAREAKQKAKGRPVEPRPANLITDEDLGLNLSTTNRHWGFLRQLTNWFVKHHPIAKLDYTDFIENDMRDPRDLRDGYTEEEGRQVFNLPPWTGSKSLVRRNHPGNLVVHDAWYFVPMIAWYTGMRREEICGLELNDIECENGLWLFNIRANSVRRLKTSTSARRLPFADELIRLGLPDYVTALRDQGETLLFPELAAESGKGKMGDAYYKIVWTKLASRLPFLKTGQATHSFRHALVDNMKGLKISSEVRADLAGHVLKSETEGRYSKPHLALLLEATNLLPKVTSHLDPLPITLLPKTLRAPRKARPGRAAADAKKVTSKASRHV